MVSFECDWSDHELIAAIVDRFAADMIHAYNKRISRNERVALQMDITAAHCNGCPLDLVRLLNAEISTFRHDVRGIHRHLDRATGKMPILFLPRCVKVPANVN